MYSALPRNKVLFIICGVTFAIPCLVFAQFTVRLIYMNLVTAEYRSGWMLVWAIFFPAMTILCGWISWYFFRKAWNAGILPAKR